MKSIRSEHYFSEYDSSHASCYNYMLANTVKKAIFVGMALLMYKVPCYPLLLSGMVMFVSLMYFSYVRPFKSPIHNVMLICEEFMTMLCFLILFKFSSATSVSDINSSKT